MRFKCHTSDHSVQIRTLGATQANRKLRSRYRPSYYRLRSDFGFGQSDQNPADQCWIRKQYGPILLTARLAGVVQAVLAGC